MNQPDNAIMVAIGHHGCAAAVEFAAEEAQRTGSPLHLVQVIHQPDTVEYAGIYAAEMKDADAEIEQALSVARKLTVDTEMSVTGERLEGGSVVNQLVRRADRARMIVLQHRRLGMVHRTVTGSVINGVAARADVPVVSVPNDWPGPPKRSVVTVAIQDPDEATELLRAGVEQARARHTRLVVLHAWWMASGYDIAVVDDNMRADRAVQLRSSLAPTLDELEAEFRDVEIMVHVRHAPPTDAILDAAQQSELLVLGRRHHLLPLGSHLGPVARATLNHSACPVLMVPPMLT